MSPSPPEKYLGLGTMLPPRPPPPSSVKGSSSGSGSISAAAGMSPSPPEKYLGLGTMLPPRPPPPSSVKGSSSGSKSISATAGNKRKASEVGCQSVPISVPTSSSAAENADQVVGSLGTSFLYNAHAPRPPPAPLKPLSPTSSLSNLRSGRLAATVTSAHGDAKLKIHAVDEYCFEDKDKDNDELVCFSTLPRLRRSGDAATYVPEGNKVLHLSGRTDGGLRLALLEVVAWRLELDGEQPRFFVLVPADGVGSGWAICPVVKGPREEPPGGGSISRPAPVSCEGCIKWCVKKKRDGVGSWLRLAEPRKLYEPTARTVLMTAQTLHFFRRNPDGPETALWIHLRQVFGEPSDDDFKNQTSLSLMRQFASTDPVLANSGALQAFVEGISIEVGGADIIDIADDGHLAEGTYSFTSLESLQEEEPLQQIHDVEPEVQDLDDTEVHEILDEDDDATTERQASEVAAVERSGQRDTLSRDEESEVAAVERSGQRRTTMTSSNKQEKEEKRPGKGAKKDDMMGRYLKRTKQVEDESADLAREKEAAEGNDFSIKRCISVLNTMQVTKQEKAKAYAVFIKSKENREAFLCGCEVDAESALIWLRNEMVLQGG